LGVLGGAFNPPHIGHLVLAQEAASQLGLDSVLLMPTGEAPHKRIEPEPGAELRLELARLAVEGDELLEVGDFEVRRRGPSYTYRTLEALREQRPGDDLFLLMGADVAAGLESWEQPRRVLELARIGLAARPGASLDEAAGALERLGAPEPAHVIRMPELDVSSSDVRRRVAERRPVRYLVPDAVAGLIEARGLYREAVPA
jgi:nicotinate-nucleotide adenylyltransferase